jgi:hypothetical protein
VRRASPTRGICTYGRRFVRHKGSAVNQNCSSLGMTATACRNEASSGGVQLFEQLPPDLLRHGLAMSYLSPEDVLSFQSTCRFLYRTIGLTPLDPPRPCFRLASHPMGIMTRNEYFRICPFSLRLQPILAVSMLVRFRLRMVLLKYLASALWLGGCLQTLSTMLLCGIQLL